MESKFSIEQVLQFDDSLSISPAFTIKHQSLNKQSQFGRVSLTMAGQEDEPKYKVFDALNRVRPPPNILDLQGRRLETKIQIDEALSNVPNYGLRKEEVKSYIKYLYYQTLKHLSDLSIKPGYRSSESNEISNKNDA